MNASVNLKALYQALDFERPLDVDKPEDERLYVSDLHSTSNPVDELAAHIDMHGKVATWLFTGHRGVGKSTELRRLAAILRRANHLPIVGDVQEYLNIAEPISIESLLLTLTAALADGADSALGGKRMERSYARRFLDFLTKTNIQLPESNPGTDEPGLAKLTLKQNPGLIEQVTQSSGSTTAKLSERVKAFAKDVADQTRLIYGQDAQVILILDSLERLRVTGSDAKVCYDGIIKTFESNAEFLKLDHIHAIYSVPPYLSFLCPRIANTFGTPMFTLPHVKIFETPTDRSNIVPAIPCQTGIGLMIESITKRYPDVVQLIPLPMLEQLILASSGSVRDFFRLIRLTCSKAQVARAVLPLPDDKWIVAAQQMLRNEIPLADDDKVWLKKIRQNHNFNLPSTQENLHQLARLFDSGVILNYRNGDDWCDAHFLLHDQLLP